MAILQFIMVTFFAVVCLLGSCSYGLTPSIAHANEPFSLPQHMPTCIYTALNSFIGSISTQATYHLGSKLEKETGCGEIKGHKVLLRLRLFNANNSNERIAGAKVEEHGNAMRKQFGSLLEKFRPTLKLRYRWAIIMSGHYWMEYHTAATSGDGGVSGNKTLIRVKHARAGSGGKAKGEGGGRVVGDGDKGEAKERGSNIGVNDEINGLDCLPRGDVLVSHSSNGGGADTGFDTMAAPHTIVSQNNEYYMMMQGDCNLVVYSAGAGVALWSSRTKGKGSRCSLSLLRDGNLVISKGDDHSQRVWASGSSLSCPSVFILIMQNDGNAVIYNMLTGLPIWATGTNR